MASDRDTQIERIAAALRRMGAVRGVANRYGKFNDTYYDQWAADLLNEVEVDALMTTPSPETGALRAAAQHVISAWQQSPAGYEADPDYLRDAIEDMVRALAATPSPDTLDVERLARAIDRAAAQDHTAARTYWPDIIAAEYARLTQEKER
jgi:hypothetical protein